MTPINHPVKRVCHMEVGDVMFLLDSLCLVIDVADPSPIGNIRFELFDLEYGKRRVHCAHTSEHFRVFQ